MSVVLRWLNAIVWGAPALSLILGIGLFLTWKLGFAQITLFPGALKAFLRQFRRPKDAAAGVSSFQALCTALAATVGTGNLIGVAGAICLGGPGAIFWMWICGILGMVTKFAEATLAVRYRRKVAQGFTGGPMYMILQARGSAWMPLAAAYSIFGVIASFGVGNAAQINAVISGINNILLKQGREVSSGGNVMIGMILAVLIGFLLLGGAKRIGAAAERMIPFAAGFYILMCAGVLILRIEAVPSALCSMVQGAFCPRAVTGGMLGSAFQALRIGCSRGVFTNEAGMGTASIAHASAEVTHPAQQGLMGLVEVFLDTIVICTLTALVILLSGVPIPYGTDAGAALTMDAFSAVYGDGAVLLLTAALILFAVAAILGWGLYGGRCAEFLFGPGAWKPFALAQTAAVLFGSVSDTVTVWQLSDTFNGLMVIPNLIILAALTPELVRLTKEYKNSGGHAVGGGTYADFHQCKPL